MPATRSDALGHAVARHLQGGEAGDRIAAAPIRRYAAELLKRAGRLIGEDDPTFWEDAAFEAAVSGLSHIAERPEGCRERFALAAGAQRARISFQPFARSPPPRRCARAPPDRRARRRRSAAARTRPPARCAPPAASHAYANVSRFVYSMSSSHSRVRVCFSPTVPASRPAFSAGRLIGIAPLGRALRGLRVLVFAHRDRAAWRASARPAIESFRMRWQPISEVCQRAPETGPR